MVLLAAAGACRAPLSPVPEAPPRALESTLVRGAPPAGGPTARCLFVVNHTGETARVLVAGRHAGWVGPRSTAGLLVGRSAGARTRLRAEAPAGAWEAVADGPPWDLTWHLRAPRP
jgi:hypothetical protein